MDGQEQTAVRMWTTAKYDRAILAGRVMIELDITTASVQKERQVRLTIYKIQFFLLKKYGIS